MKKLSSSTVEKAILPVRIVQFGEGNFLRAFADWMIDHMNKHHDYGHGVAIVQPIDRGMVDMLAEQDGLYHVIARGLKNGKAVSEPTLIEAIQQLINPFKDQAAYFDLAALESLELVISNTTEAGIAFNADDKPAEGALALTFPGKVTQLLLKRFECFSGAADKGLKFIPVELIDKNGEKLKEAILNYADLWELPEAFKAWVNDCNYFANTLVDRIVPGFPRDEHDALKEQVGFEDNLMVAAEIFHLWVIQGPKEIQEAFPADKCGLNVIYAKDIAPYRTRKVRILNGAHTTMVPYGLMSGIETVASCVGDEVLGAFSKNNIFNYIVPTIDLPKDELEGYAGEVLERFMNPYIKHLLADISLNSISKFKVRVLPTILDYIDMKGELPEGLLKALAYLIKLYTSDFAIRDNEDIKAFFAEIKNDDPATIVNKVLSNEEYWGMNLCSIEGFEACVASFM